jgi:flavoprotein, HI0933 family
MEAHYDLAVVGGGASGLAAAVAAAGELERQHRQKKIVLLEAGARVGKKLLATGNGRCNLTNMDVRPSHYHGDTAVLPAVFDRYPPREVINFFRSLGLLCREQDEGRVYPYNLQASAVLDVLRLQLEHLHVDTLCDFPVSGLEKTVSGFRINSNGQAVFADRVIFATGGLAGSQLGANGSGYEILKSLGHRRTGLFPALVQMTTDPRRVKPLKGARSTANAALLADGTPVASSRGEVQFTEHGLSGICIFELSRFVGELYGKRMLELALDLMPEYGEPQIADFLKTRCLLKEMPVSALFNGCLNKLVGPEVVKAALPHAPKTAAELHESNLAALAHAAKDFRFPVTGTLSWKDAQVTAGGIPLDEVDGDMQSGRCPGLYLAGELLNIDGDCGGFNLHWAWSTGLLAGCAAARSML